MTELEELEKELKALLDKVCSQYEMNEYPQSEHDWDRIYDLEEKVDELKSRSIED